MLKNFNYSRFLYSYILDSKFLYISIFLQIPYIF